MPATTAASLLALVGVFDVGGTIASGWLTDRWDPRYLLIAYYSLRGLSLLVLPSLLGPSAQPSIWVFIIFYGLDWVATVPPTVALCREWFGVDGPIVFGWVFASHQIGAAFAATGAGAIRDAQGTYNLAWYLAAWPLRRRGPDVRQHRPQTSRSHLAHTPADLPQLAAELVCRGGDRPGPTSHPRPTARCLVSRASVVGPNTIWGPSNKT